MTEPWSGQWVADRLPAQLVTDPGEALQLTDLVGLALRVNPRRSHLLVSRVLGKHVPTDPRIVYGAGRLLGAKVRAQLSGPTPALGAQALIRALAGEDGAAEELLEAGNQCVGAGPAAVVLGYAETATGLGHCVADALDAPYLHSTRRPVAGVAAVGGFEEEHSHATGHLLLPERSDFLAGDRTLVLVDDELSTGQTVLNTIEAVHARFPRQRYVIAALVDVRSPADRERLAALARCLGARIDVVALSSGRVELGPDVLDAGRRLVAQRESPAAPAAGPIRTPNPAEVVDIAWPVGVRDGARHGFSPEHRAPFDAAVEDAADRIAKVLGDSGARRILVLGTEELMYAPLRLGVALTARLDVEVRFSSTTRSPILPVDEAGYAIRSVLTFAAHDAPADGPGPRYAYNLGAASDRSFDEIIVVVDDASQDWTGESPNLLDALAGSVRVVVIPSYRPSASPAVLRGPEFGSYAPAEVGWLLTDLSDVELEAPVEEREEAIQSGAAHYAESLPIEYQPSVEYQQLFSAALTESAAQVAEAVGVVTELVLAERGPAPVLVSLARAGTPVGILMRRWAQFTRGLELPHYAISIVRGRGIDAAALAYLAERYDPERVVFVDGWTGKGAIARELTAAIGSANRAHGWTFDADLAVLADTGHCVRQFGTRADFLIPSACLNSTVSGLVSRTVLNRTLLASEQFHGAKFYRDLAAADVSQAFLDTVSAQFEAVAPRVPDQVRARRAEDRTPTWSGWSDVERIAADYGIGDINLVKPGVGETTRVLLRRVPWRILMRPDAAAGLAHVRLLAEQRGVEVELVADMTYSCVGLIRPDFARASATGAR